MISKTGFAIDKLKKKGKEKKGISLLGIYNYKLSCSMTCAPLQFSPGFTTTGTSIEAGPVQMK